MDYSIGATVISKVHRDKGYGTIIGFSGFDNELVDVIYETGQKIVCRLEDLEEVKDVITSFINGRFSSPHAFVCRFLSVLLQGRLTEKSLVSSVNYKIQPLPHQLLAVDFVMNRFRPRCLIADEVGLGKTIEAILVFQEYKLRGMAKRTLIVVPSGLVLQWHEELVSKFNEHFVIYNTEYVKTLKQSHLRFGPSLLHLPGGDRHGHRVRDQRGRGREGLRGRGDRLGRLPPGKSLSRQQRRQYRRLRERAGLRRVFPLLLHLPGRLEE